MKFKKMLSFMTAAAISASCMVGLAVTANAEDVSKTFAAELDTVYTADSLYGGSLNDISEWTLKDNFTEITPTKSFGTTSDEFSEKYKKYISGKNNVDTTLNVNIEEEGNYLLEMLCQEYNTRYPKVTVNDSVVFTGAPKNNQTDSENCINYNLLVGSDENRKIGTFNESNDAVIVVLKLNLNTGNNNIKLASPDANNNIQGLMAINITKMPEVNVTNLSLTPAKAIMRVGATTQLKKTVEPANASENITWKAEPDNIVNIDDNGKVTAKSAGTATVTATAETSGTTATATIEVVDKSAAPTKPENLKVVQKYKGNIETMKNGNLCTTKKDYTYKFVDGADEMAKSLFADDEYGTTIDDELIANFLNYIGGTESPHPTFNLTLPAGSYTLYYLGRSGGSKAKYLTVGGKQYNLDNGADFADSGENKLKIFKAEINLDKALDNATAEFDCVDRYLPDLYAVIIAGAEKTEPTAHTAEATGETFSDLEGAAAASFKTGAVNVESGTIKNPKWIITATKDGSTGTATVDVTEDNTVGTTFTGADIIFGIVLKGVDTEQYSDISAQFVYTVE